jgi:hypothetical protein
LPPPPVPGSTGETAADAQAQNSVPIVEAEVAVEEPAALAADAPPPTRPSVKRPQGVVDLDLDHDHDHDGTGGLEAFLSDDSGPFGNTDFTPSRGSGGASPEAAKKPSPQPADPTREPLDSPQTPVKKA